MPDLVPIRSALISVSDKAGVVEFARALASFSIRLISTGGTARALTDAGLVVTPVESLTDFPEMMDGRLKTLHPKVHGGLLGLRDLHAAAMRDHAILPIDLVCVNLYPFADTIARPGSTEHDAIENIDIGGPAMIRSASKNFHWVAPVTSPGQYDRVVAALRAHAGATPLVLRAALAREAFAATAKYDAAIAEYFSRAVAPEPARGIDDAGVPGSGPNAARRHADDATEFPERLAVSMRRSHTLSYGENPHQRAAVYLDETAADGPSVLRANQLHGKALSYNNINDAAAALNLAAALSRHSRSRGRSSAPEVTPADRHAEPSTATRTPAAVVVKHTNPCGAAVAPTLRAAVYGAMLGDPLAAYGGILAVSHEIDVACAEFLAGGEFFLEVIVAPSFQPTALERLSARWKNIRLLSVGDLGRTAAGGDRAELQGRPIPGGAIVQTPDALSDPSAWVHAAGPAPDAGTLAVCRALEPIARALSSNAIAIGGPEPSDLMVTRLFGAGAGQMDRVAACRIAVEKAGRLAQDAIAFSDAFFPFPDGPKILMDAGVRTILHPGGSKRDGETFALCEEHGVTCLTTGVRHFRH